MKRVEVPPGFEPGNDGFAGLFRGRVCSVLGSQVGDRKGRGATQGKGAQAGASDVWSASGAHAAAQVLR